MRDIWLLRLRALLARARGRRCELPGLRESLPRDGDTRLASRATSPGRRQCHDTGRSGKISQSRPENAWSSVMSGGMLFASLRDMQWRSRRLVIAIVSNGLVFAMTLGSDRACQRLPGGGAAKPSTPWASTGSWSRPALPDRSRAQHHSPKSICPGWPQTLASWPASPPGHRRDDDQGRHGDAKQHGLRRAGTRTRHAGVSRRAEHRPRRTRVAVSSTLGRHLGDEIQVGAHTLRIVGIVPIPPHWRRHPTSS